MDIKRIYLIIVLSILQLSFSQEVQAQNYIPPIGIPAPEFGINETVESVYGSDTYFTHYVDNTNPNATDANNPNGTVSLPRLTIPTTLAAGSVVEVHGGPYEASGGTGRTDLQLNGTIEFPVFIRGVSGGNRVQIIGEIGTRTRGTHVFYGQYFIIENFDYYNKVQIAFDPTSSYGAFRNNEVHNPVGVMGALNPTVNMQGEHIVVFGNEIHDNWRTEVKDNHGIQVYEGGQKYWILNNIIYNNGGNGFQACNGCSATPPRFIYIGKNEFYSDKEVGVALKYAEDVVISQNKFHDYYEPVGGTTAEVAAIIVGADGYPFRTSILFNEIYNNEKGIRVEEAVDLWVVGNVIHGMNEAAIKIEKTNPNTHIINNTIYDSDVFIQADRWNTPVLYVQNNLISSMRGTLFGCHMYIEPPQIYSNSTWENNIFWQNGNDVLLRLGTGSSGPNELFSNTAEFDAYPFGINNIIENPLLGNPQNNNFTLQLGSGAIDNGTVTTAYDTFFNLYGIDIRRDFAGNTRPIGNGWDIGAFELPVDLIFQDNFE